MTDKANRAPYAIDGDDWFMSLSKIMGKPVADVVVSATTEWGDVTLVLYKIVFADGTTLHCEGEHDLPYLTNGYGDKAAKLPDVIQSFREGSE